MSADDLMLMRLEPRIVLDAAAAGVAGAAAEFAVAEQAVAAEPQGIAAGAAPPLGAVIDQAHDISQSNVRPAVPGLSAQVAGPQEPQTSYEPMDSGPIVAGPCLEPAGSGPIQPDPCYEPLDAGPVPADPCYEPLDQVPVLADPCYEPVPNSAGSELPATSASATAGSADPAASNEARPPDKGNAPLQAAGPISPAVDAMHPGPGPSHSATSAPASVTLSVPSTSEASTADAGGSFGRLRGAGLDTHAPGIILQAVAGTDRAGWETPPGSDTGSRHQLTSWPAYGLAEGQSDSGFSSAMPAGSVRHSDLAAVWALDQEPAAVAGGHFAEASAGEAATTPLSEGVVMAAVWLDDDGRPLVLADEPVNLEWLGWSANPVAAGHIAGSSEPGGDVVGKGVLTAQAAMAAPLFSEQLRRAAAN